MFKVPSSKFRKSERLVSQKLIDELFSKSGSHSMVAFPLRAIYTLHPTPNTLRPTPNTLHPSPKIQILISVPKKRFKHAVDRNRVKRQIREAYRHNKQLLTQDPSPISHHPLPNTLLLAFVWISDELVPSSIVNDSVKKLLKHIAEKL